MNGQNTAHQLPKNLQSPPSSASPNVKFATSITVKGDQGTSSVYSTMKHHYEWMIGAFPELVYSTMKHSNKLMTGAFPGILDHYIYIYFPHLPIKQ